MRTFTSSAPNSIQFRGAGVAVVVSTTQSLDPGHLTFSAFINFERIRQNLEWLNLSHPPRTGLLQRSEADKLEHYQDPVSAPGTSYRHFNNPSCLFTRARQLETNHGRMNCPTEVRSTPLLGERLECSRFAS